MSVAVVVAGLSLWSPAASAQTDISQAQVVAACTVADNADQCKQLITLYIAKFPPGSTQKLQAIADLVVAVASTPAASDPALEVVVADAIRQVGALSPDVAQSGQIAAIADTVAIPGVVQASAIIVNRPASDN